MLYFDSREDLKVKVETAPNTFGSAKKIGWVVFDQLAKIIKGIFPFLAEYRQTTKVTFNLTNFSGCVGHEKFASLFGSIRELFGLKRIPGFSKDAGSKYLLKTRDAHYVHFGNFKFGDVIKSVVDVVEVNGASFIMRCRFMDAAGNVKVEATQKIAYADTVYGKPQRFPLWLKFVLKFSERQTENKTKKNKNEINGGSNQVFKQEVIITSAMTNAEKNVSHDEYVRFLSQAVDLFFLKHKIREIVEVEEASYKYIQDFYFGDKMVINLYVSEIGNDWITFEAEFCDEAGKLHTRGKQKVHFKEESGKMISISSETRGVLVLPFVLHC